MEHDFNQIIDEEMHSATQLMEERRWKPLLRLYAKLLKDDRLQGRGRGLVLFNRAVVRSVYHSRLCLRIFQNRIEKDLFLVPRLIGYTWYFNTAAANVCARLSNFEWCEIYLDSANKLAFGAEEKAVCAARLLQFRNSRAEFLDQLSRDFADHGVLQLVTLLPRPPVDSLRSWDFAAGFEVYRQRYIN